MAVSHARPPWRGVSVCGHLFVLTALSFFACSEKDSAPKLPGTNAEPESKDADTDAFATPVAAGPQVGGLRRR